MEPPPIRRAQPRPIDRPGPGPRTAGHWPELDLLRALACACMILNHAAVKSPGIATSPIISASEFVGGFAPVLFYFATGLGYGIQSVKPGGSHGFGFLTKVAILLVADLDFFTFIGLSMLALELIRRQPRGGLIASGLHTMAVTLKLWLEMGVFRAASLGSPGIGEVQFPRPVRPGDTLRVVTDIVELRLSASKPDRGIARIRQVTINQRGEQVMEQETTVFLKRRPVLVANRSARS